LATLTGAIEGLASGAGGLLVVAGEAGVGKSRLIVEATAATHALGVTVLTGRAVEGAGTPLRPVAEAFLAAFRDRPPPSDEALVPFRSALGSLVPEWQSFGSAPAEQHVRNEGILRLLRAVGGRRGCVLVLEDLHWADRETLTVVQHVATHAGAQPVLCLTTVRSEHPSDGLDVVRSLVARDHARMVQLSRMSDAEILELARVSAGDAGDDCVERVVCERAEGLPLLAEDIVATARATGASVAEVVPLTFAGTVHKRLAAMDPTSVQVVRTAALLGRRFDWRLLAPAASVDALTVSSALRSAVDAQLVIPSADGGFTFRHALTRDAVVSDLLPTERCRLASQALEAVEHAHPGLPGDWCDVAARLAGAAGDQHRFARLMLDSARRALSDGALAAAEATVERARDALAGLADEQAMQVMDDLDQVQLEVLSLAGKTDLVLELGESMLGRQDPPEAAATHLRLARAAADAGRGDVARRHIADTRRCAPATGEFAVRADALAATVAITDGHLDEAVRLAEQAVAQGRAAGLADAVCEALEVLGRVARRHDLEQAEKWFADAEDTARQAGLRIWEIRALHERGTVDMLRQSNLDRLQRTRTMAVEAGALAIAAVLDLQLAGSYALRLEPEAAIRSVGRGAEIARLFDLGLTFPMLLAQGACAHAIRGRAAEMEAAIKEAAAQAGDHPDLWTVAWGHCRAFLALFQEDRAGAHAAFREAQSWATRPDCGVPGAFSGLLALVSTLDDTDGSGGQTTREELRASSSMVISSNRALLGFADAVALGRAGRGDEASALLREMESILRTKEGFDGWLHMGHRLVAEAAIADGWGEPVQWLRQALPWLEREGHTAVLAACRDLLTMAGAPVPRRGRGASAVPLELVAQGVTSREMDVLAFVGDGLSNVVIAERLYLSPRTVEKHVERLKDKTGADSRAELARIAAKYGLAGA
jgi:DNA-binding CsgD family transcriptional regulator/tetratricopeptide (TPR) repeat protein